MLSFQSRGKDPFFHLTLPLQEAPLNSFLATSEEFSLLPGLHVTLLNSSPFFQTYSPDATDTHLIMPSCEGIMLNLVALCKTLPWEQWVGATGRALGGGAPA